MILHYEYYDEIDSTNNEIKRRIADGLDVSEGLVVSAGMQTAGRGRSGHGWDSPRGSSIATSIALFPTEADISKIPRLTLVAAVAVAEAVETLYPLQTAIKWPNDILIRRRKICGILTEMDADRGRVKNVIIGIGVNVHQSAFPPELAQMATSLDMELARCETDVVSEEGAWQGQTHCRELTEQIWKCFAPRYETFCRTQDLAELLDAYNDRLVNKGERVRVRDPLGAYEGEALSIDGEGRLLVRTDGGDTRAVDSGEVSVRGLYGYA